MSEHKIKEVKDIHQVQYEQILSLINILTERINMLEDKQTDEYKLVNDRINENLKDEL